MNPKEIIQSKEKGNIIPSSDLEYFINHYLNNEFDDDLMTSFLRAVHTHGMTNDETISFTKVMLDSGEKIEFTDSDIYVADKHSTGGVGDKVSLILGPVMAAAGLAIPMLAGRGLGHTGGTIDKLETIPNFKTSLSINDFKNNVEKIGICIMSQTETICPADRRMYALRHQTNTIDSVPLICGSILSKKIAEGIKGLVLDIKIGNGAFMKNLNQGKSLGRTLQSVGESFGLTIDIVYSGMDQPLGRTAGMWCEVQESIAALKGNGAKDLMKVVYELGSKLIIQSGITNDQATAISIQENLINSGKAFQKFEQMVDLQGGDLNNLDKFIQPLFEENITAKENGYIESMDTLKIGWATVELGCGQKSKLTQLDATGGIEFIRKVGDEVKKGDPVFRCFNSNKSKLDSTIELLSDSIIIGDNKNYTKLFYQSYN
jgi:pyrimidine-nucleoside phosphorylase